MTVGELTEHATLEIVLTSDEAVTLAQAAGPALTVAPSLLSGRFVVSANSYVGVVKTSDVEVRIQPKVPVDNLLFLLTSSRDPSWLRGQAAGYAASELTPAFVALFADATSEFLRRGPGHDYVELTEELDTIRGRIDLTGQFRRPGHLVPVTCRYSERTSDTPTNRYLKHAVRLAIRVPGCWARTRTQLRHALAALDGVADQPPAIDMPLRMHFNRLTRPYEPVLRLAHLLRTSVGLGHLVGQATASTFLLDMNRVFERFLEDSLRAELEGRLVIDGQAADHLDLGRNVPIRPDLLFRDPSGHVTYVADAKYKITSDGFARASDYYQLHAYCTRYGLPEGVLIYATHDDGPAPPVNVTVHNDFVRLRTLRLPLTGSIADIRGTVSSIAHDLVGRCRARAGAD